MRGERLRLLLTGVLALHMLFVADSLGKGWLPGGSTWLSAIKAHQSWEMFGKPRPKGWAMEAHGVRHKERTLLWPSVAREPSPWLYSRKSKVQQNLAKKAGANTRKHLARLLCEQDPTLDGGEITLFTLDRPTIKQYRNEGEHGITWRQTAVLPFECSR